MGGMLRFELAFREGEDVSVIYAATPGGVVGGTSVPQTRVSSNLLSLVQSFRRIVRL
jgi:hypothetical protein